ncbi:MAG: TonB-dependent receptor [Phycisphaeraceae bacterium]|nr:TonB-dependent receptor [Phycisphaeraceae bacterium]
MLTPTHFILRHTKLIVSLFCVVLFASTSLIKADEDFAEMDLDALMNVEVSSVTKGKGMKLSDAPGAISVITEEDIERSGHQSIPELLRLVPGLHVARINSSNWAISARGFNGPYNNKMLVLMDGRSLYTPLFSGVYWDSQDYVMEDLKSVEVIRGPGGTLWGANAVNGVINVTTKDAKDTQGLLFTQSGGTEDLSTTAVRYGGKFNDDSYYRVYGKYQLFDDTNLPGTSSDNFDEWHRGQFGFRTDTYTGSNHLTVQADYFNIDADTSGTGILDYDGGNILARLTHDFSEDSSLQMQFYYDYVHRADSTLNQERHSLDFDLQHNFTLDEGKHNIIWGLNYHWTKDSILPVYVAPGVSIFTFNSTNASDNTFSAFVQDTMTLVDDKLFFTVGTKIEHNDYTGVEVQPSARLSWRIKDGHTFWAAISRAVRTPSRVEEGFVAPFIPLFGNPGVESTNVMAYEGGYRISLSKALSLDLATFFNKYENQISSNGTTFGNDVYSEAYGFEATATWQVEENLKLMANYTFQDVESHGTASSSNNEGTSPRNQFNVRAYYDLNDKLAVNTALYWYDNIPSVGINSFFRYDIGLTWKPKDNVEVSIWGQNLADNSHPEYVNTQGGNGEIQSGVFGKVAITF